MASIKRLAALVWLFISLTGILLLNNVIVQAQSDDKGDSVEILRVDTSTHPRIEIIAGVLDTTGKPRRDLPDNSFAVYEDGQQVTLASVRSITDENIPLSIVLVIDTSKSMAAVPIQNAKIAANLFVDQVRDIDELSLVEFNSTARQVVPATKNKQIIKDAINALEVGGQTALYDAIAQAVKTAQTSSLKRRAIVLLSDGAEYGNLSATGREEAYQLAAQAGIPVFTIGLGYGIDEPYLTAVAENTGGAFYRSPKAEDLKAVYTSIATLLRSLYVLEFDTTLPADGSTHKIRVQFTGEGGTASAETDARYPAPIPVIRFNDIPDEPIARPIQVVPEIVADNTLTTYDYQIDEQSVSKGNAPVQPRTIDPVKLTPGKHTLKLFVGDDKGHIGEGSVDFEIAALPPEFTIVGLSNGDVVESDRIVTLDVGISQTPVTTAVYDIDGQEIGTSAQEPYSVEINVLMLAPGTHTFTAKLSNQGATGTRSVEFTVPESPRQTATAIIQQATSNAAATLTAMPTRTPIATRTPLPSDTPQPSDTPLPSNTALPTETNTAAATNTPLPSNTPLPTNTTTTTSTPLPTDTLTPSATATSLPTSTNTPTDTLTPTATFTGTYTPTPTATHTATPTATPTITPTPTPVPLVDRVVNFVQTPSGNLCAGGLLLVLIVLMILLGGRGRRRTRR